MSRLLIVSNRLPISIVKREGKLCYQGSAGGLATGLGSFYKSYESLWIGWPGVTLEKITEDEKEEIGEKLTNESCYPIFFSQKDFENYYYGFCNKTLWPLFHYFPQYTIYEENFWEAYKRVNEAFCDVIVKIAEPGDIIWVHDYQLMLLPQLIREKLQDTTIGFFLHIPFPSFEIFRLLPYRKEILEGLLGADLVGFHTYDYVRHFFSSVSRILGYEHSFGQISATNRVIRADSFPMGIDYKRFAGSSYDPSVQKEINSIREKAGQAEDRKIILSIDRLDYTKGISQRLEAYDLFLEQNPEYKGKVALVLVANPSRTGIEHYIEMKREVDELVGKINGKHGTIAWMPVWYLYRFLSFNPLVALYNLADIALVTPLRDGMNLIAKEFIATKTDGKGVLILSEMTGAANEMGEAIIVNPNNKEEVAEAIKKALEMPEEEQIEQNSIMRNRLKRYNVVLWAKDFMEGLSQIKEVQQELHSRKLSYEMTKQLVNDYFESNKRLFLLDYDGTLVYFVEKPEKAKPDEKILRLLEKIADEPKNEVVIISGRDKETLEKWFGDLNVGLIAEHGVWIREKNKEKFEMLEPLRDDWKEEIRPILELYVDRTPGSFIEEKEFSLSWHYRKADAEFASIRARELKDALLNLVANLNLGVLEGSKVMEVKNTGINKGKVALHWLSKENWDFILAIGDDWTDEDTFAVLTESAYSIKVGLGPSKARFNLDSVTNVRLLLKELVT